MGRKWINAEKREAKDGVRHTGSKERGWGPAGGEGGKLPCRCLGRKSDDGDTVMLLNAWLEVGTRGT